MLVKQYAEPEMLEDIELSQPFATRILKPLIRGIARVISRFTPRNFVEATRLKLDLAGNPYNWAPVELLGVRGFCALLNAGLFAFLFMLLNASADSIVLFAGIGAGLGFYLPILWLDLKIRARQDEIKRTLPDALDLLTTCVEAGLSFDSAMAKVAEKWNNEIGRAFGRMIVEVRLGKARHNALRDMANRAGVRDVTNFIAAVIQAEQLGAPIAKVLRIQSEQMRVLRRQRAQEQANQMPIKILFPLTFFIFPSMFVIILGPAVIRLVFGGGFQPR